MNTKAKSTLVLAAASAALLVPAVADGASDGAKNGPPASSAAGACSAGKRLAGQWANKRPDVTAFGSFTCSRRSAGAVVRFRVLYDDGMVCRMKGTVRHWGTGGWSAKFYGISCG